MEKLYQLLSSDSYQPLNLRGLIRKLKITAQGEKAFANALEAETTAGKVVRIREGLYALPQKLGMVAGKLQMNERGFGFLLPDDFDGPDIYIGAGDTATAFHGDRVMVRLNEPQFRRRGSGNKSAEKLSGAVVKVLQRARTQLVGTLQKSKHFYIVVPDEPRIPQDIYVPEPMPPVPVGYKVVVRLGEWPSRHVNPEGVVTEVLGAANAPGVDLLSIIKKFELPEEFPEDVEAEARAIPTAIPKEEIRHREDFRSHFVMTIDPDDAKDFDDALSYKILDNGDFEIYVHIADVSAYVKPGTALDREASRRGNSVYLVHRVIPMLPEKLSNGICSLQPGVDRLVRTAVLRLNKKGEVVQQRFASGIIHSKQRFTYKQAFKLIQKPDNTELWRHLAELVKVARVLRRKRFDRGALDLDFPEFKVRLDENGKPVMIERIENDESHQLIEEYMLLANEAVAKELRRKQVPAVYRIHENPDPLRLEEFRMQLKSLGISVGNLSQRGEVQKLLLSIRGKPEAPVVKVNLLKSLRRAMYSTQAKGHFGLAKQNYTHFTSPIRRYADLLVHRALYAKPGASGPGQLEQIIAQINQTEKNASDAENESVKLKKLEYFDGLTKQAKKPRFKALVLEIKSFGILVELPEFQLQGLVAISEIKGDIFVFDNRTLEMRGQRTRRSYRAGQEISVEAVKVDLFKRQINFSAGP